MKHKIGFNRLGRKASSRKALLKNMVSSLFKHERIVTTHAKALATRVVAERMITRAKEDSVHNRRVVGTRITDQGILAKLFTDIGPRFKQRPGGYTRIYKLGPREGDATEMVILELVDRVELAKPEAKEKVSKEATPEKSAKDKAPKTERSAKKSEGAEPVKATKARTQRIQKVQTTG